MSWAVDFQKWAAGFQKCSESLEANIWHGQLDFEMGSWFSKMSRLFKRDIWYSCYGQLIFKKWAAGFQKCSDSLEAVIWHGQLDFEMGSWLSKMSRLFKSDIWYSCHGQLILKNGQLVFKNVPTHLFVMGSWILEMGSYRTNFQNCSSMTESVAMGSWEWAAELLLPIKSQPTERIYNAVWNFWQVR